MRQDGGDGLEGSGVELAGGLLRWHAPGVSVEARRAVARGAQRGTARRRRGVSVTARAGPRADGRGLFLALSPRWGAGTGGARALWREELPTPAASGNDGALDAEVGYGFFLPQAGRGGDAVRGGEGWRGTTAGAIRLGTRLAAWRAAVRAELAGERREGAASGPEHVLGLDLQLRF